LSDKRPAAPDDPEKLREEALAPAPISDHEMDLGDFEDDDFESPSGDHSHFVDEDPAPPAELSPNLPQNPDDLDPTTAHLLSDAPSPSNADDDDAQMRHVVGVRFQRAGRVYSYDCGDTRFLRGEQVVVESDRGPRMGTVAQSSIRRRQSRSSTRRVLRRPEERDRQSAEKNVKHQAEVVEKTRKLAKKLGLPIKVFRAEYNLAGSRVTIYFSADAKIDHRPLAAAMTREVRARVDLRQTGVRDEAKMVGGIGSCGQPLCCSTWLPAFVPVSIRNAKDQGLVLNPAKVSGQCGRLKCCLVYEQALYAELRKGMPKLGKRVVTTSGDEGRVVEVDVLHQRVRVSHGGGEFRIYDAKEVTPLFASGHRRENKPPS